MVSHWGLLAMATPGSEAPSVGAAAPPTEDALGSRRSEDVRKRQRGYQAAHLKKKKEEAEEAARELAVLREERGLIARSLVCALDSHERPSNLESLNLLTIAQIVAGMLIKSRSAGPCVAGARAPCPVKPNALSSPQSPMPSTTSCPASRTDHRRVPSPSVPAQGPVPAPPQAPPPAHGPALGNWPTIVTVDLTKLLTKIREKLPLALLLQGAHDELRVRWDEDNLGHIDITSNTQNEVVVQEICAELKQLLGIPCEDSRCALAAKVLNINSQAAIGAYLYSRLTKAHGHCMGVLNLLIGGTKTWRLWKPGPRPVERDFDECIVQKEGDLLWLPPGWYHEVVTNGVEYMDTSTSRNLNKRGGAAYSLTFWHVPAELRAQTVLTFALSMSEEKQMPPGPGTVTATMKQRLYDIFVDSPVKTS